MMSTTNQQQQPTVQNVKKFTIKSHGQSEKKLYLNSKEADIHFSFDLDKTNSSLARIPAHKHLLAVDSDEFKALFYDDLKNDDDIHVTDVTDAAFKQFLQFFYLSEVELNGQHTVELMHLGHKYNVIKCVEVCVKYLKETATADNIMVAMGLAILYNHEELVEFCGRFIILNTDAVLESVGFLKCGRQTLAHIINENLLACSDVKVFEACMEWVKAKSKQNVLTKKIVDTHLGDLFYEIRFGSMAIREFCNLATKYDAVLSNDFKTITKHITLSGFQAEKFNTRPRKIDWNDAATIVECDRVKTECDGGCPKDDDDDDDDECYCGNEMGTSDMEHTHKTTFSTNEPLHLISFCTCTGIDTNVGSSSDDDKENRDIGKQSTTDNGDSEQNSSNVFLSAKLKITEMSHLYRVADKRVLMTTNVKLYLESTKISLPWPVLIKPTHFYRISIKKASGNRYWYDSTRLKDSVQLQDSNTIVKFHDCPTAHDYGDNKQKITGVITSMEFIKS